MKIAKHGFSIGIERIDDRFYLSLKAVGKLTHEDYETITPMIDSALGEVKHPKVRVFFDASELEGWELRAAWDDFKLGLKHGNEFEKVAMVGSKKWLEICAKLGSWFLTGEIKTFDNPNDAWDWLHE